MMFHLSRLGFNLENWHAKPAKGRQLFEALDGMRGLAILMVVSTHTVPFLYMDTPLKRIMCFFSTNGTLGVWLFFVLSGFLITLPFFKRVGSATGEWCPHGYVLRRAAKVIPPFYVSIWVMGLFVFSQRHDWHVFRTALMTMAFLHAFWDLRPPITPLYWSLAAEVTFYCAVPFIFYLGRRRLRGRPWIVPAVLIGSSLVTLALSNQTVRDTYPFVRGVLLIFVFFGWGALFSCFFTVLPKTAFRGMIRWGPFLGLIGFLCSCLMETHLWLAKGSSLSLSPYAALWTNVFGLSVFLMLFVVYFERDWIGRLFCTPLLVVAGLVSYEWYLFHLLFIGFSNFITGSDLHGSYPRLCIRIFFAFPVAFVFSALFYRFFSLPILRWAHRPSRQ
jgi:peptidoglycan/LPS O-acetylase OafA/YrhL